VEQHRSMMIELCILALMLYLIEQAEEATATMLQQPQQDPSERATHCVQALTLELSPLSVMMLELIEMAVQAMIL
jgi:hypothetical protein